MVLYAWCGSPLGEHSLNTVRVALATPRLRRTAEVLALKLRALDDGLGDVDAIELVLLPLAFHDLGKACVGYQGTVRVKDGECRASFTYHEVLSAALIAKVLSTVPGLRDSVKYVIVSAVLNHHYAMRSLERGAMHGSELLKRSGQPSPEAPGLVRGIRAGMSPRSRLAESIVKELEGALEEQIESGGGLPYALNSLLGGLGGLPGGFAFLRPPPSSGGLPRYIASALTGLVNISDSISAHCERGGTNVFAEELMRELGTSCGDLIRAEPERPLGPAGGTRAGPLSRAPEPAHRTRHGPAEPAASGTAFNSTL